MEQHTSNKIKLGIFTVVGILLLLTGIYFIGKRQQMFNTTFRLSAVFKDIGGLQVGNNIRFLGINVGIVENIEQVTDTSVRVDMQIEDKSQKYIKQDATALVGTDGLMGNKILTISPGTAGKKTVKNNDYIKSTTPISLDDILLNLKISTENSAIITSDLAAITSSIGQGKGSLGKLIMDDNLAIDLSAALNNIKVGAGEFKNNMDSISNSSFLQGYLLNLKTSTENTAKITRDLAIVVHNIEKGRGTVGKLLMDDSLSVDLGVALVNISEAAGGFKNNMDALSHSVFLRWYFKKKLKNE